MSSSRSIYDNVYDGNGDCTGGFTAAVDAYDIVEYAVNWTAQCCDGILFIYLDLGLLIRTILFLLIEDTWKVILMILENNDQLGRY